MSLKNLKLILKQNKKSETDLLVKISRKKRAIKLLFDIIK